MAALRHPEPRTVQAGLLAAHALEPRGLTDDEAAARLGRSEASVVTARRALVAAGWLFRDGRRQVRYGRVQHVWRVSTRGRQALAKRGTE